MFCGLLHFTKHIKQADGSFPIYYYVMLLIVYAVHQVNDYSMCRHNNYAIVGDQVTVFSIYVALMAFHAKKSDPAIGGTYMTLLNTVTNLGGNWPATLSLWMVEHLDIKNNGITTIDGYYVETLICVLIGFVWLTVYGRSRISKLQSLPASAWKCS